MVIEGPIVTSAAAFATTLGHFNLIFIFILATLGDLIGDLTYYGIGYLGYIGIIRKYGYRLGISQEKIDKLKNVLEKHPWRIITAIKLSPILPPTLILVGGTRFSFKKYLTIVISIILPKALIFITLGYFFGKVYDPIYQTLNNGSLALLIIIIIGLLTYYGYRKISIKVSKKLEEEE